jgi:tetratricopeptide (TPR) repeat protein
MRTSRAIQTTIVALTLLGVVASAQNNRAWSDPYQDAVRLIQGGFYDKAVPLLEAAVKANPKAELNRLVEGVFRIDYLPYYWLGIAYFELHQTEKAQENFQKARNPAPRDKTQLARLNDYQAKLQTALAAPKAPAGNPAFGPALQRAESALEARRFADALAAFDAARNVDGAEYNRRNVQARRDEAARAFALQLDEEGRRALGESLSGARAKFQQAEQTYGGLKDTADGLAEVKRRDDQYQQAKAGAERDISGGNFKAARDKLNLARLADREQFMSDNLPAQLNTVNSRLNAPQAASPPAPAAALPATAAAAPASSAAPAVATPGAASPAPTAVSPPLASGDESRRLFENGRLLASQFKYAEAEAGYASALQRDPNNLQARDALDKSRSFAGLARDARSSRDAAVVRKKLEEARALDPARFDHEQLNALLSSLPAVQGEDPLKPPLRSALMALLRGDAQASISILQPVSGNQAGSASSGAALHAYLGVAYATRALSSTQPDEQTRLNNDAREQFRLALSLQSDYQLSPRVVSPRIVAMFEQARR